MNMLRSFVQDPDRYLIMDALDNFDISANVSEFQLLRFEAITPDSFMWRVVCDGHMYYLYAEDYIPSLGHIKSVFHSYIKNENWELVPCKVPEEFESSSPVQSAQTYKPPEDVEEMMKYAVGSGHDFVFLARSSEEL